MFSWNPNMPLPWWPHVEPARTSSFPPHWEQKPLRSFPVSPRFCRSSCPGSSNARSAHFQSFPLHNVIGFNHLFSPLSMVFFFFLRGQKVGGKKASHEDIREKKNMNYILQGLQPKNRCGFKIYLKSRFFLTKQNVFPLWWYIYFWIYP